MKILIGCEFSGIVRDEFRDRGHECVSCDLLPSERGPLHHHQEDVRTVIKDGSPWDMIIMHPPCTALTVSGNRWYGKGTRMAHKRKEAVRWTMDLFTLAVSSAAHVAMENPVGVLPIKASQYIQPWQFGHPETKRTGLWLHNLPKLEPTNIVAGKE